MKKVLLILLLLLSMTACNQNKKQDSNAEEKYKYLIESLANYSEFSSGSIYYDLSVEMSKIDNGYRYYVTLDNPRLSMYEVQIIAVEKGVDHISTMAASSGVLDSRYSLIPNQSKIDDGFVKGIVISGTSSLPSTTLNIYVDFYNRDYSKEYTEYIQMDVSVEE